MARIRSIKPEVRISEKVNSWPIEVRYFWVLLWGYCDDFGYGRDNARLIVADSFPLDDTVTAAKVEKWMDVLWASGVIERFMVGEQQFFHVVNWDEHQKISHPSKRFLPNISEATEVLLQGSVNLPRVTGLSEKTSLKQGAGSREMEQGDGHESVTVSFEDFWSVWPKKNDRKTAKDAWDAAVKRAKPAAIVEAARLYAAHPHLPARQFIPHGATWLRHDRWDDPLPEPPETEQRFAPAPASPNGGSDRSLYCVHDYPRSQCGYCEVSS